MRESYDDPPCDEPFRIQSRLKLVVPDGTRYVLVVSAKHAYSNAGSANAAPGSGPPNIGGRLLRKLALGRICERLTSFNV